jgi:hypothetical protein
LDEAEMEGFPQIHPIATVANGVVTGVSEGTATITANNKGYGFFWQAAKWNQSFRKRQNVIPFDSYIGKNYFGCIITGELKFLRLMNQHCSQSQNSLTWI